MIQAFIEEIIRKHGPGHGTAVCLGNQLPGDFKRTAGDLFRSLGYSKYYDIDYNGKASVVHDLNLPLPDGLEPADLLYDGGTIEHVANISQALQSTVALVKVGGVLVATNPVNQYAEAYYSLDPTLAIDFYAANGFECKEMFLWSINNWRTRAVMLACRFMPKAVDRFKAWCMKQDSRRIGVRNFVFKDRLKDLTIKPWNRMYIHLPHTTAFCYVGVKRRSISPTVWPHQGRYPAA